MVNEAVIIELYGTHGDSSRFLCADSVGIEKGALLALKDPRAVSGAVLGDVFCAGIANAEKVANDGAIYIGAYTYGIFDMVASGAINLGSPVSIAGYNAVKQSSVFSGASILGYALEDAISGEVIAVKVAL